MPSNDRGALTRPQVTKVRGDRDVRGEKARDAIFTTTASGYRPQLSDAMTRWVALGDSLEQFQLARIERHAKGRL